MIRKPWAAMLDFFERGDLVPLLIVVSAAHYMSVLADHDAWPVAVAIGVLVDLGHYRWVRAAARYDGVRRSQIAVRWAFALVMTAVSLAYHWRYYGGDLWLSAPMPLLIASLAWLAQVDRKHTAPRAEPTAQPERVHAYTCSICERGFDKPQQLAAHSRVHIRERRNGHEGVKL